MNEDSENQGARAQDSDDTEGLGKKEEEPPVVVDASVPTSEIKYYTAKVEKSPVSAYERALAASGVVEEKVEASRVLVPSTRVLQQVARGEDDADTGLVKAEFVVYTDEQCAWTGVEEKVCKKELREHCWELDEGVAGCTSLLGVAEGRAMADVL